MKKILSVFLILVMSSAFSGKSAHASVGKEKRAGAFRMQVQSLPLGANLVVELKNHSTIEGELASSSEESFDVRTPEPTSVRFADVRSVDEAPAGQATPGGTQYPAAPKHHYVRIVIITLVVCFTFALVTAIASK